MDSNFVKQNGTASAKDSIVSKVTFEISKNALMKNESAVLNIIAANKWKRPIYFTLPNDIQSIGLGAYLRRDGMTYRLVPVLNQPVNNDTMFNNLMYKFSFGNAQIPGVYFDEENRRHLTTIRETHTDLAMSLINTGRKEDARKVLEKCDKMMLQNNMPYGMASRYNQHNRTTLFFLDACYKAEDSLLAKKVSTSLTKDLMQQMRYYKNLSESKQMAMMQEIQQAQIILQYLDQIEKRTAPTNDNK